MKLLPPREVELDVGLEVTVDGLLVDGLLVDGLLVDGLLVDGLAPRLPELEDEVVAPDGLLTAVELELDGTV